MNESPSLSLLIVDDEPDMLRGLARIMKLRGFEVATVGSGEAAVEYVRHREPDGILMFVVGFVWLVRPSYVYRDRRTAV